MGEFNIHNVRFYEFHPEAIHCIAYNNDSKLLALSRADNNIELWDNEFKPFKQDTLFGTKDGSIEALVWCGDRLFSAGLNGFIIEYDIKLLSIKDQFSVTGGPTWSLALSPNKQILAAGTEGGYVCLFEVQEEGLMYSKMLKKQKSRILSISWHEDGDHLATGSVDYVHLISTVTEKTLQFPVAKTSPTTETLVWCVSVLPDRTVVTGDSRGKTCFWDGRFGTLLHALQTHHADVLTMQVTPDSLSVYVAGVDPVIAEIKLVDGGGQKGRRRMWVKSVQRRVHTHDVRALALTHDGKLFSGGVDTYLALSFYPPRTAIKYPATPPHGYVSVGKRCHAALLGYKDRVELWRLGRGRPEGQKSDSNNQFMAIVDDRLKLAEISLKASERLECCAVSPLMSRIAYCAARKLKVLNVVQPDGDSGGSIEKLQVRCPDLAATTQVLWLDEDTLVSASGSGVLQALRVSEGEVTLQKTLLTKSEVAVRSMTSSDDGRRLAVLDATNVVTVFAVGTGEAGKGVTMPKSRVPVTAVGVTDSEEVFVVYSSMSLAEYSAETSLTTPFGKWLLNHPFNDVSKSNNAIRGVSFAAPSHVFLHTASAFYVLNRNGPSQPPSPCEDVSRRSKAAKYDLNRAEESNDSTSNSSPVKTTPNGMLSTVVRSNHVHHFAYLQDGHLLSVETNPIWLVDSLPPALKVKKFGGS